MKTKEITQQLIEFYDKLSSWEHGVVKGSGLTPSQMHMIEIVGHAGSIQMKELAEKNGVTTGTLTVAVDKLEKQNYILRKPHEKDRRSYMIVLTDEGEKLFEEHYKLHIEMTQDLLSALNTEEQKLFPDILEKIIQRLG